MSTLSGLFGGGLKPKFQEFTSSGTFTPSAGLLAQGGVCFVTCYGAGGSGGRATGSQYGGGGGGAGFKVAKFLTLSSALTVTLGSGASSPSTQGYNGLDGGDTTFGSLITAKGGKGGMIAGSLSGGQGSMYGERGVMNGSYGTKEYFGAGGSCVDLGGVGGQADKTSPPTAVGLASGGGAGWSNPSGAGTDGYCRVDWWE
jgi:hypothetical protein